MKHIIPIFLIILVFVFAFAGEGSTLDIARVHVVANSDSERDIEIKGEVAEGVVEILKDESFADAEDIEAGLTELLPEIERVSNEALALLGADYTARAEVGVRYYDKKSLGSSAFPAGEYLSLVVTLGEGAGHNWWSVLFPEISTQASLAMGEAGNAGKNICVGGGSIVKIRCLIIDLYNFILTKR